MLPDRRKSNRSLFLPKIPGAEENYGMVYNKPETEAEKNMHVQGDCLDI